MRIVREKDDEIKAFLEGEKVTTKRMRWRSKGHKDYSRLSVPVLWDDGGRIKRGQLNIQSHFYAYPRKFAMCLVFYGERVLGLDVNPMRSHRSILRKSSINVTHWHRWTLVDPEPDDRNLSFHFWLREFLKTARINAGYIPKPPPMAREVQLEFPGL